MYVFLPLLFALWNVTERVSAPSMSLYSLRTDGEAIYWLSCPAFGKPCSLNRLAANAKQPEVVTADFKTGGVYTIDGDSIYLSAWNKILQIPKRGGKPRELARVEGWIKDIKVAGGSIYVSTADTTMLEGPSPDPRRGTIVRFPKAGGAVRKIIETSSSDVRMVIDARRIYFVGESSIQAVPIDGGPIKTLTRDDANPVMSIAADRDAIYYAAGGEVRRVPKAGGAVSVLYKSEIVLKVYVENGFVYASRNLAFKSGGVDETAAIVRIPITGGNAEVIASPSESPQDMAVNAGEVFVLLSSLGEQRPDRIVAVQHAQ